MKLIRSGKYNTQGALVAELSSQGFDVNQGTVSRELRARGIRKENGVYIGPREPVKGVPVYSLQMAGSGCLAVVKTAPAFAPMLGQTIDDAKLPGVLGTVSGDDTVFVAFRNSEDVASLSTFLGVRWGD